MEVSARSIPSSSASPRPKLRTWLNDVLRLGLAVETVSRLHQRTEGWAAGLYLAALSMRDHRDADELIARFSGGDRRIVDYLAGEVLDQQPEVRC